MRVRLGSAILVAALLLPACSSGHHTAAPCARGALERASGYFLCESGPSGYSVRHVATVVVPNVVGEAMCPAVAAVAHAGLKPVLLPPSGSAGEILRTRWRISRQQPAAGSRMPAGGSVSLNAAPVE